MNKLIAVGFVAALAACGGGKSNTTGVKLVDGGSNSTIDAPITLACNVLTQTGCATGQKCAWVYSTDSDPTSGAQGLGAIACAPNGTVATGAACAIAKAAMGGNDNCLGGNACIDDVCKSICEPNGGAPMCATGNACVTYDGVFANVGATTTPAGVCDPSCDPLADNDFDGSGTVFHKSGTGCGGSAQPTNGCHGQPSADHTSYFTCGGNVDSLTHRAKVGPPAVTTGVDGTVYLNSCMSGYEPGQFADSDANTMQADCFAWCAPGDSYMGLTTPTAGGTPNGIAPHRCNDNDALGDFSGGTPSGAATSNGEHCMFSWTFEVSQTTGAYTPSPTSDTLGVCIDHTKYHYDSNLNGMIDSGDAVFPPCASLPKLSTLDSTGMNITVYGSDYFACITSTEAGITSSTVEGKRRAAAIHADKLKHGFELPEFPMLKMRATIHQQ